MRSKLCCCAATSTFYTSNSTPTALHQQLQIHQQLYTNNSTQTIPHHVQQLYTSNSTLTALNQQLNQKQFAFGHKQFAFKKNSTPSFGHKTIRRHWHKNN
jgi:hypothetical protein